MEVSSEELNLICNEMKAGEWKRLGRQLDLEENELEEIEHDHLLYGIRECCYQMLLRWKRKTLPPSKMQLLHALAVIQRNDLVLKISKEVPVSSQTTECRLAEQRMPLSQNMEHRLAERRVDMPRLTPCFSREERCLPVNSVQGTIKVEDLHAVSKALKCDDWKPLGRRLGLSIPALDALHCNNVHYGLQEMCYQMLVQWKQMHGSNATREQLIHSLSDIGRQDICEFFSIGVNQQNPPHQNSYATNSTPCKLSHNELDCISRNLNHEEWKALGNLLGLSDSSIMQVEFSNREFGESECAYQMLVKWTQEQGSGASKDNLASALLAMDKIHLLEILFGPS